MEFPSCTNIQLSFSSRPCQYAVLSENLHTVSLNESDFSKESIAKKDKLMSFKMDWFYYKDTANQLSDQ